MNPVTELPTPNVLHAVEPKAAPVPAVSSRPTLLWGVEALNAAVPARLPWLWQGFLAPGAVTLLTSQWKSGKTTLTSVLLAKLRAGGTLADLPLAAGQAVVVSEESPHHWKLRARKLDFGNHIGWYCKPFRGKPQPKEWRAFVEDLAQLCEQRGIALVVIDPFQAFYSGKTENDACTMLEALSPLNRLTARGVAVLVLHHPGRGDPPVGQLARGSGALCGFADILLEMRCFPGAADDDRRRRLNALSRYEETPRQLVIEWTVDGADYVSHGSVAEEEFVRQWETLRGILAEAPFKLTRREIRQRWPGAPVPDGSTLIRWLERATTQGLAMKDGKGLRGHPFRYWLPERVAVWLQDPLALLHMPELFQPADSGTRSP